jgi:dTDP-glucose 4,6-dehydratase
MSVVGVVGAGLVGGELSVHLAEAGHHVINFSRHLSPVPGRMISASKISSVVADFLEPRKSFLTLARPLDCLVHTAYDFREPAEKLLKTNNSLDENVIQFGRKCGVSKIIYLSTQSLYRDFGNKVVNEKSEIHPKNSYLLMKHLGEELILSSGIASTAILRIGAPIGRGMPLSRYPSKLLSSAMIGEDLIVFSDGSRRQQYIDTRDIAIGVSLLISSEGASGTFNISGPEVISNLELALRIKERTMSSSEILISSQQDPDSGRVFQSIDHRIRKLGFQTKFSLEDSIDWIMGDLHG